MSFPRWQLVIRAVAATLGAAVADSFTAKVIGVSDGDTLSVLRDGKPVKIRLHGVDAPRVGSGLRHQGQGPDVRPGLRQGRDRQGT